MSSTLKGGMIGCGWFAENHRQAWQRIPGVDIVAAADVQFDRAQRFAPRAYKSGEELLDHEELDFVDIATHAASHRRKSDDGTRWRRSIPSPLHSGAAGAGSG